ncbi:hypothetical protein L1887_20539 [Cichorium endivia]|nr:hypothetical protein L1887_20539 [Cichorium endivia]
MPNCSQSILGKYEHYQLGTFYNQTRQNKSKAMSDLNLEEMGKNCQFKDTVFSIGKLETYLCASNNYVLEIAFQKVSRDANTNRVYDGARDPDNADDHAIDVVVTWVETHAHHSSLLLGFFKRRLGLTLLPRPGAPRPSKFQFKILSLALYVFSFDGKE